MFQTNPCGVEAFDVDNDADVSRGFRRTLVGLKLTVDPRPAIHPTRFRRTLVGLKL